MTQGMQAEQQTVSRGLAQLHGDLGAIEIIQRRLLRPLAGSYNANQNWYYKSYEQNGVSFEGKKHLWNMLSRLTSRVESVIISDRGLLREVIHLAAKGRGAHD